MRMLVSFLTSLLVLILPMCGGSSQHLFFALNNTKWIVNNGDRLFWLDNWAGRPLWHYGCDNLFITIRHALDDNYFCDANLPTDVKDSLDDIIFTQKEDFMACTLNSSGAIKIADIYNAIRVTKPKVRWYKFIWNILVPTKYSVFIWRCFNFALPVDVLIQRRNVSLASKCTCCNIPNIETIDHLLVYSETASYIWNYYMAVSFMFFAIINLFMISWIFGCLALAGNPNMVLSLPCFAVSFLGVYGSREARSDLEEAFIVSKESLRTLIVFLLVAVIILKFLFLGIFFITSCSKISI